MANSEQQRPGYFAIGTIVGAHGIRGEVKVLSLTDYPERFRPGSVVFLDTGTDVVPAEIVAARPHKNLILVKLAAIPDRNAAELMRGRKLLIPEDQAMPLGEYENYAHDLIGLTVETAAGEVLGEVVEILFAPANDVYVISGPFGELLLPALREVVLSVDLLLGKMIVEVPEGLRK